MIRVTRIALMFTAILVVVTLASPAEAQEQSRLMDAYKREFAFLEAEKRALQKRIEEAKTSAAARIKKARSEIASLQGRVVYAAGEAERLAEVILAAERDIDALDASEDVGDDMLVRAASALEKVGVTMPEADVNAPNTLLAQLQFAFTQAPIALSRQGTVRIEDGAYFDDRGVKVQGHVLHVGAIASYGLVDGAKGPLAPAGERRLKLWSVSGGAEAATALQGGQASGNVPIFLYESLDKQIERKKDKTVREIIETGGVIAWVIVGMGLLALAMIVIRALLLAWSSRGGRRLLRRVLKHIDRGDIDKALGAASTANNPCGRVLTATLRHIDKDRAQIEDVVAEAVLQEQPNLSRFGSSILVMAAVSPLMGLLGTVTGMISTFDIITEFGTGNPKLLSGGISEALVTTELGLIVAIPALLCGHVLSGWSERIRDRLDAAALAAVNRSVGLRPPTEAEALVAASPESDPNSEPGGVAQAQDGEIAA